ncbi:metallophosphoesterase [Neorhizobium vignae]|uniref:metallophosphoesterase n=1 Tax=Neorhizobium vignae TaxID=690585 RepID=UPI0006921AE0|nr:metallophosphoesterase [Neorhizobium vignae]
MPVTYAVGDVHGRADLLGQLLASIQEDAEGLQEQVVLVFLGDIVDRGFESRRAMDLVGQALIGHPGSALIFGNHDSFFVLFLPQHLLAQ